MADEGNIPFARRLLFDGRRFDPAFHRTMQQGGNSPCFGYGHAAFYNLNALRDTKGIRSAFARFTFWGLGTLLEAVAIGSSEVA